MAHDPDAPPAARVPLVSLVLTALLPGVLLEALEAHLGTLAAARDPADPFAGLVVPTAFPLDPALAGMLGALAVAFVIGARKSAILATLALAVAAALPVSMPTPAMLSLTPPVASALAAALWILTALLLVQYAGNRGLVHTFPLLILGPPVVSGLTPFARPLMEHLGAIALFAFALLTVLAAFALVLRLRGRRANLLFSRTARQTLGADLADSVGRIAFYLLLLAGAASAVALAAFLETDRSYVPLATGLTPPPARSLELAAALAGMGGLVLCWIAASGRRASAAPAALAVTGGATLIAVAATLLRSDPGMAALVGIPASAMPLLIPAAAGIAALSLSGAHALCAVTYVQSGRTTPALTLLVFALVHRLIDVPQVEVAPRVAAVAGALAMVLVALAWASGPMARPNAERG